MAAGRPLFSFNAAARLYHELWFRLSERIRWSDSRIMKNRSAALAGLTSWQIARINELQVRYDLRFETHTASIPRWPTAPISMCCTLGMDGHEPPVPREAAVADGVPNTVRAHLGTRSSVRNVDRWDVEDSGLYPTGYSRYDAARGYIAGLAETVRRLHFWSRTIVRWRPGGT